MPLRSIQFPVLFTLHAALLRLPSLPYPHIYVMCNTSRYLGTNFDARIQTKFLSRGLYSSLSAFIQRYQCAIT